MPIAPAPVGSLFRKCAGREGERRPKRGPWREEDRLRRLGHPKDREDRVGDARDRKIRVIRLARETFEIGATDEEIDRRPVRSIRVEEPGLEQLQLFTP